MELFLEQLEVVKKEGNTPLITIAGYLQEVATKDSVVARNLCKPTKSLEKCYAFIGQEARKEAINGCAIIEDSKVFGWALHYYDEDDLDVDKDVNKDLAKIEEEIERIKQKSEVATVKKAKTKSKSKLIEYQGVLFDDVY